jgi:hypothetical protein
VFAGTLSAYANAFDVSKIWFSLLPHSHLPESMAAQVTRSSTSREHELTGFSLLFSSSGQIPHGFSSVS